jgi:outer membrane murein-binding lipoprotein Lpp
MQVSLQEPRKTRNIEQVFYGFLVGEKNMNKFMLSAVGALVLAGCQTTPLLDSAQPAALNAAVSRAKFDFNCPTATGQVLSRENVQEPMGTIRFSPTPRVDYTIGVSGCGKRGTFVVVCAEGGGCVAGEGRETQN